MEIRELYTNSDFAKVFELEKTIWQTTPDDVVPTHILNAIIHNGGILIGAEYEKNLIGFTFGIPARHGDDWWLWSHMTGVLPHYQGQGIGFQLKQAQRHWALQNGYERIKWTFDPLQRGNANFNVRRLGTISNQYFVNLYGDMRDGINEGMPSDRLETTWHLRDRRVVALASEQPIEPLVATYPLDAFLLRTNSQGEILVCDPIEFHATWHFVEIPSDIRFLKKTDINKAKQWQLLLRRVLQAAIANNYAIVDFVTQLPRCWYVLQKQYPGPTITQTVRRI